MNEKYDIILNTKSLRNVVFSVGFGFVMGSKVVHMVDRATYRLFESVMRDMAKNGNKFAQKVCNKVGVEYKHTKGEKEVQNKAPIGFHA